MDEFSENIKSEITENKLENTKINDSKMKLNTKWR